MEIFYKNVWNIYLFIFAPIFRISRHFLSISVVLLPWHIFISTPVHNHSFNFFLLFMICGIETNMFWQSSWFNRKKELSFECCPLRWKESLSWNAVVFRRLEKVTCCLQTQRDSIWENTSPSSSFSSLLLNSLICAVFGQRKGSRFNHVVMNQLSCYWGKLLAKYTNTQHTNPFEVPFLSSPSKFTSLRSEGLICLIIDQYLDETRAVDWGRQLFLLIGWVMNYKEVQ